MTLYRFKVEVLTPVHIGTGETLDPSGYAVLGNRLFPFSPSEVVADLPEQEKARFEQLVLTARPDWKAMQNFLTHQMRTGNGRRSIAVSARFLEEYRTKLGTPYNQLKLQPFQRNIHTGELIIPGSSLKGAIRTAVISQFANSDPIKGRRILESNKQEKDLEPIALNYTIPTLERDPFRGIKVVDVSLSGEITRIDRVIQWNPKKPGQTEGIALWYERLFSHADEGNGTVVFELVLQVEEYLFSDVRARRYFGENLSMGDLVKACNIFYRRRMEAELEKFFGNGHPAGEIYKQILEKWPTSPSFIIRVGRFCQFESLSVDGFRRGWNIQAKKNIADMGSTRNLCRIDTSKGVMDIPFGWIYLTLMKPGETVERTTARNEAHATAVEPNQERKSTPPVSPVRAGEAWKNAHVTWKPGSSTLVAKLPDKRRAECRGEAARRLLEKLPEDRRTALMKKGLAGVRVAVRPIGNAYEIMDLVL
jgi:CRISPR-associated protein Csm5